MATIKDLMNLRKTFYFVKIFGIHKVLPDFDRRFSGVVMLTWGGLGRPEVNLETLPLDTLLPPQAEAAYQALEAECKKAWGAIPEGDGVWSP